MIWYLVSILVFLLVLCLVLFMLFKSSTPKNFSEFLMEMELIWIGLETNIQDIIYGPFYNKVCKWNFQKLFLLFILHSLNLFLIYIKALYSQSSSVAVLTGGNRGLGLDVLKKLLQCEMTVILGILFTWMSCTVSKTSSCTFQVYEILKQHKNQSSLTLTAHCWWIKSFMRIVTQVTWILWENLQSVYKSDVVESIYWLIMVINC